MTPLDGGALPPAANRSTLAIMRDFMPYLWPAGDKATKRRVSLALALMALQKMATVSVPLIYGVAVDLVADTQFTVAALLAVLIGYAVVRLAQQTFDELKHFVFARVAQRAIRTMALQTFRHLHGLSLRFHLNRQTGGLSRVIERGVKSIEFLLTFLLFSILPTLLELIFVFVVLWLKFDWRYAVVMLFTIGGYAVYTITVTEWRIRFRRLMNEADKHANTRAVDSLLNYETVKYFNAEEYEARRYDDSLRHYENAAVKSRTSLSLLNIGQGVIIAAGLTAIMFMAGLGIKSGQLSVGDFAVVNVFLLQLYLPLNFLGSVYREVRQALTDMEDMFVLLKEPAEVQDKTNAPAITVSNGEIEFRNVRFSYGRGDILRGISFKVAGGKKTAVVGPSGAGKSTIARLLFRFYDPQDGAVLIDDQDISVYRQESIRAAIAVVPQDTVLFNDTIGHNIGYGNPEATHDDIHRAARLAAIDKFIEALPDGYDTPVGERGLKLSGGEKQRVAIARAILKNPAIFVFDEATSALDSRTEKSIQHALDEISQAHTTLVVAHRLSTIVNADEIIVLSDGLIAERGRHADLLAKNGLYATMWERQQTVDKEVKTP